MELNIFLNKIKDKSITHNIFRIQENEPIMCGFYCIALTEYMNVSILKVNMVEKANLEFRLRKINETRNYLLDEIKQ